MSSSGATLINVRRDVDDAFYRYKMPKLTAKVEGRGNGIKTVILNLIDVSKALARPPLYLLKYFGNEVGAQVIADEKNAKHILTGSHPVDTLQDILDTFIQRFVLCSSCGNPETDLVIGKDEMIDRVCKACGKASLVDMRHKIAAFILKNPPESLTSANAIAIQEYEADQDDELAELADLTLEDDEEASNALDELQSIDVSQAEDRVREFIQGFPRPFCPDAVKALGKDLEIPDHLIVAITVQELFDGSMLSEGQIEQHASALCRLIGGVQRRELALLGGIERVISVHFPGQLLEKTSAVLARLYQSEVVSEEALEFWKENISKRYQAERKNGQLVRKKAGVFFDWLATAAEEEEEESEEESEAE